ncbi:MULTISPECIES: HlyD family secretion protein [unclassified Shinella]|uniref:HlyD family secretion protein n=1 Tax=unclassified Shinella TaxID=2643062 RepID=UPI00225D640F|nr:MULTISPECIES: HlyD family secretion protein [unclassified Shinella]MCO5136097.1 HlyD family secretion protein [Shinella sp.]MDC7254266.1 HlyD family secretion protein [Shinella sp. YE25]CAI0336947.1 Multidrug resistance efflux pump [Rhizobiaceae bacterium]CAK7255474.1 membrane fusion protein, multidrug efflux system [Shinella sp. WSC3-e]
MKTYIRNTATALALVLGVAGIGAVLYAWQLPPFASEVQTTDNAYVRGYVTLISPQLAGYVTEVSVKDYEMVKAGAVLARLDDRIFRQKVEQANATLASQKAALANSEQQENAARARIGASEAALDSATYAKRRAEESWNRIEELSNKGIATQSDREQSRTTLDQAEAAIAQAQANLEVSRQDLQTIIVGRDSLRAAVAGAEASVELAKIDLSNTVITAPRDGAVGEVGVKLGQYVAAGTQLMAVVPHDTWVIANFKETQLAYIKPGQKVEVSVDALKHATLTGRVERFSPATGSEFSVIKPDNATGNFTKVAQRVPVRIAIDDGQALAKYLAPGLSVVVTTVVGK